MSGPLRWGVLSAGDISADWVKSFSLIISPNDQIIVGIAARSKDAAQRFAETYGIPLVFESYEDLCKSPEIDVVYIGSIHPAHLPLGKLALSHGKHVLCEKPLCVNARETKELVEYAREKNLFLMEAIWSRFFPATYKLREELSKGTIGDVLQVIAAMGVLFEGGNWREWDKSLCASTVLDIGTYPYQLASLVYGGDRPIKISAAGHLNSFGVDYTSSATLLYTEGRTATVLTHQAANFDNTAHIIGTKGIIKIGPNFWCPTHIETPTEAFDYPLPENDFKFVFWNCEGLTYQCKEVLRCIREGLIESPLMSHQETIVLAEIREEIRKQIGVTYPQDNVTPS